MSTLIEQVKLAARRALAFDIGFAGILLYIPYQEADPKTGMAWTDGERMYFTERFLQLKDREQQFVVAHQALHVAFRHVSRARKMESIEGRDRFNPSLWNLAADAVVNNALSGVPWCQAPTDAVVLKKLVSRESLSAKAPQLWTVEAVYRWLQDNSAKVKIAPLEYDLRANADGQELRSRIPSAPHSAHVSETDDRVWEQRLRRAQAGSQPFSVLRRLSADIPAPSVRWEKVLRQFLTARVLQQTEENWNRPSRRSGHVNDWYEPGIRNKPGARCIGIMVDTSGSISDQILARFVSEINSIVDKTGAELHLVVCDAAVQSSQRIRTGHLPGAFKFKGGGGTDFRPAVAEMETQKVTCGVYLTDLLGIFPSKPPRFPILWAAATEHKAPFGKTVRLSDA